MPITSVKIVKCNVNNSFDITIPREWLKPRSPDEQKLMHKYALIFFDKTSHQIRIISTNSNHFLFIQVHKKNIPGIKCLGIDFRSKIYGISYEECLEQGFPSGPSVFPLKNIVYSSFGCAGKEPNINCCGEVIIDTEGLSFSQPLTLCTFFSDTGAIIIDHMEDLTI